MADPAPTPAASNGNTPLDGTPVTLTDGKTYTIPPFNFDQLKRLLPILQRLDTADPRQLFRSPEIMSDVLLIVQSALSRNYPEVAPPVTDLTEFTPDARLWTLIDVHNVKTIMRAVYDLNGLELGPLTARSP